ncbi:MAG: hypothetical protein ACREBA_11630 [Nitrosotalea sp.]
MAGWDTLRVPHGLMEELEKFLDSPTAKKTGFTSKTQATTTAMREFLLRYSKRFEHLNTYEDKVRILDNNIGKDGDIVTVQFKGKVAYCNYCESKDCIHVKYCWEIPEVAEVLKKHGLKIPD